MAGTIDAEYHFDPGAQSHATIGAMAESAVGSSLKAARQRLGWSREALAFHSGVSWSAISQIESGRRVDVRLSSLSALARALGVTTDYLGGSIAAGPPPQLEHRVLVYGSDDEYVATVAPFLQEGIERSDALLVVTTPRLLELIRRDLGAEVERGKLLDAADWYSSPLETLRRYRGFVDDSLEAGFKWVRIVGEPVWAGRSAAEVREWSRYESIINLSLAAAPATIVCPYDSRSVPANVMHDAECTHSEFAHAGGSAPSASYREPEDFLLQLE
jgi:transcriptional regulator with XRE-family HTH domain